MRDVIKNPRVLLLMLLVVVSLFSIAFNGLEFGIDFKGGTIFQIQLDKEVTTDQMDIITSIISERLDAFGLLDTKVNSLGADFVAAQIAETDPEKIEHFESLLKTQGKFEATVDGEVLFEGSDILQVYKDAANGYGVLELGQSTSGGATHGWQLPFLLNQHAAESFSRGVFHRCTPVSFDNVSGTQYDCERTYFFIDRPSDSVIIVPANVFSSDSELLFIGNPLENISQQTSIDELFENASVPYIITASGEGFSEEQLSELKGFLPEKERAIVHPSASVEQRESLESLGFVVVEVEGKESIPWVWTTTGARQVISITPGIANLDPYVEDQANAKIFANLLVQGSAESAEDAARELKSLQVLLETGSLPIGIKSISTETVSPRLGEEFLNSTFMIGFVGLIVVSLVIFVRYRIPRLVIPIILTGLSEIILIAGFASILRYNLDLAAVAGILATVGTGVDHQIIITDELLKGETSVSGSFLNRIRKAFFIIFAAAATTVATMLPIILFSFGFGKLRGFAITIVIGVLIGVLITRPAFSIIAESVLKKTEQG